MINTLGPMADIFNLLGPAQFGCGWVAQFKSVDEDRG